jgi:hypothetical protein
MVESEYKLSWIVNFLGTDAMEFLHDRGGVVMGHDVMRANGNEVARRQWALGPLCKMGLREFFNYGLRHN